jgi:hypothetical protein
MKFSVMQQVYIQSDTFNLGAPVNETGFVAKIDRHVDQAQEYCVRVPSKKEFYWLPECDLMDASEWLSNNVDNIIQDSIIDFALDHKDEKTFKLAMQKN